MMTIQDGLCHARKGLLVLRDCGKQALSSCGSCGTGLCEDHQILTSEGIFCPDCAAQDDRFSDLTDERLERARYRREGGYYSEGFYYVFSEADYETFESEGASGDEAALEGEAMAAATLEGEDETSDSDDLDSFMES